jgi:hypothetical protein
MTYNDIQMKYRPFPKLTKEFVAERINAGWADLAWAASNNWLDSRSLGDLADRIADTSGDVRADVALAVMEGDDTRLHALIDQQARHCPIGSEEIRGRWLLIAIAWLYQHRGAFSDPWAVIEDIWEAFDHAPALNGLIRWMPVPAGGKPGEAGMMERWRELAVPPLKVV